MSRFLRVARLVSLIVAACIGALIGRALTPPDTVAPAPTPSVAAPAFRGVITEDMAAWSCRVMGDRACGEAMVSWGNGGRIA